MKNLDSFIKIGAYFFLDFDNFSMFFFIFFYYHIFINIFICRKIKDTLWINYKNKKNIVLFEIDSCLSLDNQANETLVIKTSTFY